MSGPIQNFSSMVQQLFCFSLQVGIHLAMTPPPAQPRLPVETLQLPLVGVSFIDNNMTRNLNNTKNSAIFDYSEYFFIADSGRASNSTLENRPTVHLGHAHRY